jgi:photosystem II stability/assembly factor-like uncharacterized protein
MKYLAVAGQDDEAAMAKAGLLFVGTEDGIVLFSDPGGVGRWLRIGQELRGQVVRAIWPAADTPLVVLAAVEGAGLQRSADGGQSWQQALDVEARAIAGGDRHEPHRMYASTPDGAIYRSDDAGANWLAAPQGAWPAGSDTRLIAAGADALTLYLGLDNGTVWASADGGTQWARYGTALPAGVTALAESQIKPGYIYALAGDTLYSCIAAQAEWQHIETAPASAALAVLAGKEPAILLARGAGGLARSDDAGASWADVGPDVAWEGGVMAVAAVRYHMDMALAGSSGGQLAQSADRGRTWQILKQGLASIRSLAAARLA